MAYALLCVRQEKKCLLRIGTQTGAVMTHGLQTASKVMFVEGIQKSWNNLWSPTKNNNKPATILHNEPVGVMVPSRLVSGRCPVRISAGSSVIMTKNFRVFRYSLMHILT
jgi:hypothetical protein